jgi:hypothetical protein
MQTDHAYFGVGIETFQSTPPTGYLAGASLAKALRVSFKAAATPSSVFDGEKNGGRPANAGGSYIVGLMPLWLLDVSKEVDVVLVLGRPKERPGALEY